MGEFLVNERGIFQWQISRIVRDNNENRLGL